MPRLNFTVRTVEALKPKHDRMDYFDTNLPGFFVRVTPTGVKTFGCMYYVHGRKVRYTIGTFPPLTLFDARTEAKRILGKAELGSDPAAEKIEKREAGTFGELTELYVEEHVKPNKAEKSQIEDQRQIDAYLLPKWKHVKAAAITIDDVETLLDAMKKNAPVQANRTRSLLRHMFRWALAKPSRRRRFMLSVNPVADVEKPSEESPRERVYSDDELKAIWKACDQIGTAGNIFKLQLLTAARPGEVTEMEWSELELSRALWKQPSAKTKNGKVHVVPLAPAAVRILEALNEEQSGSKNPRKKESHYVFHNPRNPDQPITWLQKAALRVRENATLDDKKKVDDFRPHDLRRTGATRLAEMGVPDAVLKMILNHSLGSDITGVYNQYKYFEERKQALEAWAKTLTLIVSELKEVRSAKATAKATSAQ